MKVILTDIIYKGMKFDKVEFNFPQLGDLYDPSMDGRITEFVKEELDKEIIKETEMRG